MDGSRGRINKTLNDCLYTLHPSQVKHGLTPDHLQLVHVVFYTIPFQPRFRPKSYWFAPNPCLWKLNTPLVLKRGRLMNYSRSGPNVIPTTSEFTYISIHIHMYTLYVYIPTTIYPWTLSLMKWLPSRWNDQIVWYFISHCLYALVTFEQENEDMFRW